MRFAGPSASFHVLALITVIVVLRAVNSGLDVPLAHATIAFSGVGWALLSARHYPLFRYPSATHLLSSSHYARALTTAYRTTLPISLRCLSAAISTCTCASRFTILFMALNGFFARCCALVGYGAWRRRVSQPLTRTVTPRLARADVAGEHHPFGNGPSRSPPSIPRWHCCRLTSSLCRYSRLDVIVALTSLFFSTPGVPGCWRSLSATVATCNRASNVLPRAELTRARWWLLTQEI